MSSDEFTPLDERCACLLAAFHEAQLAGESGTPLTSAEVPPELRPRLERDLACLRLLDKAWPQFHEIGSDAALLTPNLKSTAKAAAIPTTIGRFRIREEL